MTLAFDVFWSFRSPYSYLAAHRLVAIARDYDVDVAVRPVYPLAVRAPEFFDRVNPLWPPYVVNDCARIAEMDGVTFVWPKPDPVIPGEGGRRFAADQPHITRLTRLGIAAVRGGRGLAFVDQISRLIFGGIVGWNEDNHLAEATARAGLDLADLEASIAADQNGVDAEISQNEADQESAGHWGVPLMVFEGEPFFGQDRIDVLVWRLKKAGLRLRR